MICPKCKEKLLAHEVENTTVEVDVCSSCHGIWFDAAELDTVLGELAVQDLDVPAGRKKETCVCPRCGKIMASFLYPQTYAEIDMCQSCKGIWLDSAEFDEISVVRQKRREEGTLDNKAPVSGIKGGLINFINKTIDSLSTF